MKKAVKIKTEYNKKRYGHHHKKSKSFSDTYFPYLPMTIILFLSVFVSGYSPRQNGTLAYATEISRQSLLNSTNSSRSGHSKGGLKLNEQLNSAAQAKANDMVARNYWSHNTPDGKEPWVFINGAGYSYIKAGENLAYGFTTSSETINGWMNSPSHKANMLDGDFTEVGFGYANSSNFNNAGEETVVVAMYGKPYVLASTSSSQPQQPTAQQPAESSPPPATQQTTQPTAPEPTRQVESTKNKNDEAKTEDTKKEQPSGTTEPQMVVASSKPVTRAETITSKLPPWSIGIITFAVGFLIAILLLRHGLRFRKLLKNSADFVTHHPLIDSTILALVILGITLLRNVGNIL
jgi:uncharacterized protein YkwD